MKIDFKHLFILALVLVGMGIAPSPLLSTLNAQPVINAENTALGSGGTAYLDGFESTFYNPANLAIPTRQGKWHIGIGQIGTLYEPVLSRRTLKDQSQYFADQFLPYSSGDAALTESGRNSILSEHYGRSSRSQHRSRSDLVLGGLLVQQEASAFSLVARARMASRIEVGRGWYDEDVIPSEGQQVRDFTLHQQKSQLYEVSFGFAREFTFFNGLFPGFNKLYVGIAPKIVFSGPRFDASYTARYLQGQEGLGRYQNHFTYQTTGSYSDLSDAYFNSGNAIEAIDDHLHWYDYRPTGYGFGVDFGLTYLIPLGNDIPALSDDPQTVISKSLRFALSVNDLGIVQERRNPLTLSSPERSIQAPEQEPASSWFSGASGQYLTFLSQAQALPDPLLETEDADREEFQALLPTSVNAGFLLDLHRLKFMGDLALGLDNTAFSTQKMMVSVGIEIRPVKKIPLRAGTRLASDTPVHFGLGTGFESRYWDFTLGTQLYFPSGDRTPHLTGAGFAGFQIHL